MKENRLTNPYAKGTQSPIGESFDFIKADDAKKGVDYFCPDCNGRLRRKVSKLGTYFFFHLPGEGCSSNGLETVLHLLTKKVIETEKKIWLPTCRAEYHFLLPQILESGEVSLSSKHSQLTEHINTIRMQNRLAPLYSVNYFPNRILKQNISEDISTLSQKYEFGLMTIDHVRVEKKLNDIRPDLIATIRGKDYLIEVANTHYVDDDKLVKIQRLDIPTIEIDVSDIFEVSYDSINNLITKSNNNSYWLHYSTQLISEFEDRQKQVEKQYSNKLINEYQKKQAEAARAKAEQEAQNIKLEQKEKSIIPYEEKARSLSIPVLKGSIAQKKWAYDIREKRINSFGLNDLYIEMVELASDWINAANQILYKHPFKLSKYKEKHDYQLKVIAENLEQNRKNKKIIEDARAKAEAFNAEPDLPNLEGSPPQIVRAGGIRSAYISEHGRDNHNVQTITSAESWIAMERNLKKAPKRNKSSTTMPEFIVPTNNYSSNTVVSNRVYKTKPVKTKRIKVQVMDSFGSYKRGMTLEMDEDKAMRLFREFKVKPVR